MKIRDLIFIVIIGILGSEICVQKAKIERYELEMNFTMTVGVDTLMINDSTAYAFDNKQVILVQYNKTMELQTISDNNGKEYLLIYKNNK